jgi:hypothetical protein
MKQHGLAAVGFLQKSKAATKTASGQPSSEMGRRWIFMRGRERDYHFIQRRAAA